MTKRSKVRRNNLSYLRQRSGKSARLKGKDFDRVAVNDTTVPEEVVEEAEVEVVEAPAEAVESTEATEKAEETAAEAEEKSEDKPAETEAEANTDAEVKEA